MLKMQVTKVTDNHKGAEENRKQREAQKLGWEEHAKGAELFWVIKLDELENNNYITKNNDDSKNSDNKLPWCIIPHNNKRERLPIVWPNCVSTCSTAR